jgi:hypothetical protein
MAKKQYINIEQERFPVVENLGYSHSIGVYAVVVEMPGGKEKVAVKCNGSWKWHKPKIEWKGPVNYPALKGGACASKLG